MKSEDKTHTSKVRLLRRPARDITCCNFESWIKEHHASDEARILKAIPRHGAGFFPDPVSGEIPDWVRKVLREWIENYLMKVSYVVIIKNGIDEDVQDVTIEFWQNVPTWFMTTGPVGPYTKSLSILPAGETVSFDTCPCLYMASDYNIYFGYHGQVQIMKVNIDDLNKQEQQQYGQVDMCGDSLEIYFE
jgi:hypothetical protein